MGVIVSAIFLKVFDMAKEFIGGKTEDEIKDKIAAAVKSRTLKEKLKKILEREKQALDKNTADADFMFENFQKSVTDQVLNEKSLALLLDTDSEKQEREMRRICNQCAQDAAARGDSAKEKIQEIVGKCIQEVLESIDDPNKSIRDTRDAVGELIEEATDKVTKYVAESSSEIKRHSDEAIRHIDERFNELITLLMQSQIQQTALTSDNQDYLDLFDHRLFLEPETSKIKLRDMFIPPLVDKGEQKAEDCIADWCEQGTTPCMILYGDAGIGKSSLVAKIISKACEVSDTIEHPNDAPVLAVALRDHCELFSNLQDGYSAKYLLLKLFGTECISDLQNKLLILDGFDELTVLSSGFDEKKAEKFINSLTRSCKTNMRILITSREGYFNSKNLTTIVQKTLCWEAEQVADWCLLYGRKNSEYEEWCRDFPEQYRKLPKEDDNDKRYEILCIPFILYLCCNSKIDLNKNKTVCKIYDQSFRKILLRAHSNELTGNDRFLTSQSDQQRRLVHWQYTKEIAYQMFLNDTLTLSDACEHNDKRYIGFKNAKERTIIVLKENYGIIIDETDLHPQQYLSVFRFAKNSGKEGKAGITFVHKTVYEYFTALKLYEDYFAKFNSVYFENNKTENGDYAPKAIQEVMNSFIKAFRYKPILKEDNIFDYLCGFVDPPFEGEESDPDDAKCFDFDQFSKAFSMGTVQHYLSDCVVPSQIKEYKVPRYKEIPISAQLNLAFCNFTWFLTGRGYSNSDKNSMGIGDLVSSRYQRVNMQNWMLPDAFWGNVDLRGANLTGANLEDAHLSSTCLANAHLDHAIMKDARLQGANLTGSTMNDVQL